MLITGKIEKFLDIDVQGLRAVVSLVVREASMAMYIVWEVPEVGHDRIEDQLLTFFVGGLYLLFFINFFGNALNQPYTPLSVGSNVGRLDTSHWLPRDPHSGGSASAARDG